MEDDGWVHVDVVAQQGRPDKKVYGVTDDGRAELARWIAEPLTGRGSSVTDSRTRELAVKIRGAAYGDVDALRGQVAALRSERARQLDTYLGFEKRQFPNPSALDGPTLHQYLVLRGGILAEEGSLRWLDEVLTALGGTAMTDLSEPVVALGPWLHHPAQPGRHGLDAHRASRTGPATPTARRVLRRACPRRRRADHHRRLRPQPHRLAAARSPREMLSSADARRHRRITSAVHDEGGKILLQVLHAGRYAYHPLSVSASSIKAPINLFGHAALRDVNGTIDDFVALRTAGPRGRVRRRRDHGQRGLSAQPVPRAAHQPAEGRVGRHPGETPPPAGRDRAAHPRGGRARLHRLLSNVPGGLRRRRADVGRHRRARPARSRPPGPRIINTGIGWHEARVPTIVTSVPNAAFVDISNALAGHVTIPVVASNRINMPQVGRADPRRRSACS